MEILGYIFVGTLVIGAIGFGLLVLLAKGMSS